MYDSVTTFLIDVACNKNMYAQVITKLNYATLVLRLYKEKTFNVGPQCIR
jgi:hypothetical protein